MMPKISNPMETNCALLMGLLSEEKNVNKQLKSAKKEADSSYNQLSLFSKLFYPLFGATEVDSKKQQIASLKDKSREISHSIQNGFEVLQNQERRESKVNRAFKQSSANVAAPSKSSESPHNVRLAQFERMYENYDTLRAECNSNEEAQTLEDLQISLVYRLIKSGTTPTATWVNNQLSRADGTFKSVLTEALSRRESNTEFNLLHLICKAGNADAMQLICDCVAPEVIEKELEAENSVNSYYPLDFAFAEGHSAVVECVTNKFPNIFTDIKWGASPIGGAIESGNIHLIEILAKSAPKERFDNLIRWEGDEYAPLSGRSPLSWAISHGDEDVLRIMQKVCPETVKEYKEVHESAK